MDFVTLNECIKYPECWKEVKEVYQILSLKSSQDNISDLLDGDKVAWTWDNYPNFKVATDLLKAGKHSVYSIKRVSDNIVFTIGDTVEHFDSKENKGVITKIGVISHTIPIIHFEGTYRGDTEHRFTNSFDVLKHSRKVLFVTEDGVDLYKGDEFYFVDEYFGTGKGLITGKPFVKLPNVKEFSTKKAAEEYIDMNKPWYSKQQIIEACDKLGWIKGDVSRLLAKL